MLQSHCASGQSELHAMPAKSANLKFSQGPRPCLQRGYTAVFTRSAVCAPASSSLQPGSSQAEPLVTTLRTTLPQPGRQLFNQGGDSVQEILREEMLLSWGHSRLNVGCSTLA